MDEITLGRLRRFVADIKRLPNESAKTHRFAALVAELFPGSAATVELAAGMERRVVINLGAREKTGRIDSYYGNAIVEFENSLAATGAHAEEQLREYTAGEWTRRFRPLTCIASDGIVWRVYHPRLKVSARSRPQPSDVDLRSIREMSLGDDRSLGDFWLWLTSTLFRPGRAEPTAARFVADFSASSSALADAQDALESAWASVATEKEPKTAFDAWRRYLTVTYGSLNEQAGDRLVALFLKHTYLASVSRLLIWAAFSEGKTGTRPLRDIASLVLSGEYFRQQRIENLVEDDFFQWVRHDTAAAILAPVWERILDQLLTYDLAAIDQDILKGVYQELVDPEDRHELGEYYTPDWLCTRVVTEILPTNGFVSVLDPTCGSGSFLRATIAHLLASNPRGSDTDRLKQVLDNVVGIDIHPLAVIISKATYLLAVQHLARSEKRPIQIPVYLADSLFLPAEVTQLALGSGGPTYEIRFGKNKRVEVPEALFHSPHLFDPAIAASSRVAIDHAKSQSETTTTLRAFLKKEAPGLFDLPRADAIVDALWLFTKELADLIKKHENSIWSFVVRNAYRPAMLQGRFDYVVGNPPWLAYRFVSDPDYQQEIKRWAVDHYKIASGHQRLNTQMELATIFLLHSLTTFGKANAKLGFVMPWSVLSGDQHHELRIGKYDAPVTITQYWDFDDVAPLFNVPSCVLFATRKHTPASSSRRFPCLLWSGNLPRKDISWADAEVFLATKKKSARIIYLGARTAISTLPGQSAPNEPSVYSGPCHQGATVVPRSCYFITGDFDDSVDPDALYSVETDPEQAKESKKPYHDINMSGRVEGRFLFSTAISKHVVPFGLTGFATLTLPLIDTDDHWVVNRADALLAAGHRDMAKWMYEVERLWHARRKRKADKQDVYERLDYNAELSRQRPSDRHVVLYNHSGTNVSATYFDRSTSPLPFIVDVKLYCVPVASLQEGRYLAAVLNSSVVDERIKPFQSRGLAGERDIHKKVLDLAIPGYAARIQQHKELASLGERAARVIARIIAEGKLPASLARRRAAVRVAIADILGEIDQAVERLLAP